AAVGVVAATAAVESKTRAAATAADAMRDPITRMRFLLFAQLLRLRLQSDSPRRRISTLDPLYIHNGSNWNAVPSPAAAAMKILPLWRQRISAPPRLFEMAAAAEGLDALGPGREQQLEGERIVVLQPGAGMGGV